MAKKKTGRKLATLSALQKKYDTALASEIAIPKDDILYIPSRMIAFTNQVGGGFPYGKIIEIYGEESSGKSLMAYDLAYCTQALGGIVLWCDSEHAYDAHWSELNGIDNERVQLYQESAIEKISDFSADMGLYWRSQLKNNEPILLVIDSIAALDCLANKNMDQTDAKAEMGNRAKQIDKFLRIRNEFFYDMGITVVCINQLRSKIGASQFEDPDTTPGGKAMRFYASIRVGFYGGKSLKEKIDGEEEEVGRVTSIRIKKNKVAPKRKTLKQVPVIFHPEHPNEPIGFDKYYDLPHILERKGIVKRKKGGSIYYYKDKMIARGNASFLEALKTDAKLRRRLLKKTGINTISSCKRKLENLDRNLYPVSDAKVTKHEETE